MFFQPAENLEGGAENPALSVVGDCHHALIILCTITLNRVHSDIRSEIFVKALNIHIMCWLTGMLIF